jgi:sulfoxide reductase heme-binding subunit YedZ
MAGRCLGDIRTDGEHSMMLTLAAVAHTGTALWYLTRATGLISLILLSATVVLGIVASVGWTTERWPRFLSQAVHRNLSLFCMALLAIHIVTTVADGYVPISYLDAFIPFLTPYRPLWIGLGALAFDMLLAVGITSGLRRRIGVRAWRGVHYLAYACWPIAVLHGLGSGTDARLPIMVLIEVVCIASVVSAVAWRLVASRRLPSSRRLVAAGGTAALVIGIGAFALAGPLQPGWSRRAGTSAAVLAEINARYAASSVGNASGSATSPTVPSTTAPSSTSIIPTSPFTANVSGTIKTSAPNSAGGVEVLLSMELQGSNTALVVKLIGTPVNGGVSMTSSSVALGNAQGVVTALDGSTIGATVLGPRGRIELDMQLSIDQSTGSITGTVSGTSRNNQ